MWKIKQINYLKPAHIPRISGILQTVLIAFEEELEEVSENNWSDRICLLQRRNQLIPPFPLILTEQPSITSLENSSHPFSFLISFALHEQDRAERCNCLEAVTWSPFEAGATWLSLASVQRANGQGDPLSSYYSSIRQTEMNEWMEWKKWSCTEDRQTNNSSGNKLNQNYGAVIIFEIDQWNVWNWIRNSVSIRFISDERNKYFGIQNPDSGSMNKTTIQYQF